MRFSLATIALVGLGNLLFSVNGAPSSLSQRGSGLNTPDGLSKRVPAAPRIGHDPDPTDPGQTDPNHPTTDPSGPHIGEPGTSNPATGPHIGQSSSSSSSSDHEDSEPDLGTSTAQKQVPELGVGNPYTKTPITDSEQLEEYGIDPKVWPKAYNIKTPNFNQDDGFVDRLGVNPNTDEVSIFNAQNKYDTPSDASQKLYTSDIVMSVFKAEGKNPSDLKQVHIDMVQNKESTNNFDMIFSNLKLDKDTTEKSFYASDEGAMRVYFKKIAATPFPKIVDRMNQQFKTGKRITQFTLKPHPSTTEADKGFQDLEIYLGV